MADEKSVSTLEEDKVIAEGLDFNALKEVAKELNAAIDVYNSGVENDLKVSKARVVGAKKLVVFIAWRDAVDLLFDAQFEGLPESSVNYYNAIYAEPEDAGEVPEETPEPEPEPEPAPKKEPKSKKEPAPKKDPKPKKKGSSLPKSAKDFSVIKEQLKEPKSPTGHFDRICLEGGTVEQLLAKFRKFLADSGIEFKSLNTLHSVKTHIEYRIKNGYVYEDVKGKIKLVGFEK